MWKDSEAVTLDSCHMGEQLTAEQRDELCTLLEEFSGVMSNMPGVTSMAEHRIETGNARPVKLPPYRIPQAYRETIQLEVKEMLEAGIIEPSSSDWCAPIVPAVKVMKPSIAEGAKVRFLQEAAVMGQFFHPNVVKLHGVVTVGEPVSL